MAITMEEHREYMVGFNLYCDGKPQTFCTTHAQTVGWRAARRGVVYANAAGIEVAQGNGLDADRIAKALTVREMAAMDEQYAIERDIAQTQREIAWGIG